jgi:hypothetical protein
MLYIAQLKIQATHFRFYDEFYSSAKATNGLKILDRTLPPHTYLLILRRILRTANQMHPGKRINISFSKLVFESL